MDNERRIEELEANLRVTDWIITRIHEAKLLDEDFNTLLVKYYSVIIERTKWREELGRLKEELENESDRIQQTERQIQTEEDMEGAEEEITQGEED